MIQRPTARAAFRFAPHLLPLKLLALGLLASILPLSLACRGGAEHSAAEGDAQTYTVRGEVVAVPGGGGPTDQLRIRHEAVPDFVGIDGDVVGMASMTMPFPTADGVDVASLAPGDKVEFTLEVRWEGTPGYRISALHKLPPDTELELDKVDSGAEAQKKGR